MSRMNPANAAGNDAIDGSDCMNVAHAVYEAVLPGMSPDVGEAASGCEIVASTSQVPSGLIFQFLNTAQVLMVMMDIMIVVQQRMISIAGALHNAVDVSIARDFLRDFVAISLLTRYWTCCCAPLCLFSLIRMCAGYDFSCFDECLLHTPSSCRRAQECS